MNCQKLSNIPLSDFRDFLFECGCSRVEQGSKGRGEQLFGLRSSFQNQMKESTNRFSITDNRLTITAI